MGMTKRLFDLAVASALGLATLPLMAVTAVAVRVAIGRPVLFRQQRPGLHGRPFELVKFRTMTDTRGPDGVLLPDTERMTRVGRLLRATSLDELPTLLNVIRGDMSLVGPRPLLMEYLAVYTPEQSRRHEVRPGVTGLAQVLGRNRSSWPDRLRLDVWYVDHRSLGLDVWILGRTLFEVLRWGNTHAAGHVTMPRLDAGV
jgi:lipopolysaccharide/colanic/teichoic acid biosynthesis glycosyltransferase